ncbi:hypothetical protein FRAHR75_1080005 [Frankia sp. Hr75.2]|nr:hypothetical protein FRAHR75_1080005 [Frankia sp. Hr75.2]
MDVRAAGIESILTVEVTAHDGRRSVDPGDAGGRPGTGHSSGAPARRAAQPAGDGPQLAVPLRRRPAGPAGP